MSATSAPAEAMSSISNGLAAAKKSSMSALANLPAAAMDAAADLVNNDDAEDAHMMLLAMASENDTALISQLESTKLDKDDMTYKAAEGVAATFAKLAAKEKALAKAEATIAEQAKQITELGGRAKAAEESAALGDAEHAATKAQAQTDVRAARKEAPLTSEQELKLVTQETKLNELQVRSSARPRCCPALILTLSLRFIFSCAGRHHLPSDAAPHRGDEGPAAYPRARQLKRVGRPYNQGVKGNRGRAEPHAAHATDERGEQRDAHE